MKQISVTPLGDIPTDQRIVESKGGVFKNRTLYHYNEADINVSHRGEGAHIFYSTQKERLQGFISRFIRWFKPSATLFKESCYFRNDEKIELLFANDPFFEKNYATSYFIGHSTTLLTIPCESGLHISMMIDPVEGDINPLVVPRMVPPAKKMEECPLVDVLIISHNHLDHFQKSSLKKLVAQQPYVFAPLGDKKRLVKLGFKKVIELNWWESVEVPVEKEGRLGSLKFTTVPANHWSGQSPLNFYQSAFLGFVLHLQDHDVYLAGDTARLSNEHINTLQNRFNIKTLFQPGGPDETREDMKSAHQSSVDALWMHFNLGLRSLYEKENYKDKSKVDFLEQAKKVKTVFNHIKAYKLGNVHFDDTERGVRHVLEMLLDKSKEIECKDYEVCVAHELLEIGQSFVFAEGSHLTPHDIVNLINTSVIIPQLGSLTRI